MNCEVGRPITWTDSGPSRGKCGVWVEAIRVSDRAVLDRVFQDPKWYGCRSGGVLAGAERQPQRRVLGGKGGCHSTAARVLVVHRAANLVTFHAPMWPGCWCEPERGPLVRI
jgi:hypothetical protein